jgi:hypothetical protein
LRLASGNAVSVRRRTGAQVSPSSPDLVTSASDAYVPRVFAVIATFPLFAQEPDYPNEIAVFAR